ncbi:hypothetical protein NQ318_005117 [Aromia moschata]|uniref:Large ribosomal subunit protein bL35m n=1 Tax=Aromia moschata TaxID=1265417 RepID=A0AAV8XRY2_9CUCU|nr:hypothetical protein NQ318_005117 [Aromia moschata]
MFRALAGAVRIATAVAGSNSKTIIQNVVKPSIFQSTTRHLCFATNNSPLTKPLLANPGITKIASSIPSRDLTKFSYRKGRRKAVKAVLKRFYRLHWGGWIRTKCGRNKRLWRKSPPRKRRLRQHVFCNATQSHLLDKMVGSYWRKPKYYVEDPYEPYHIREEWQFTYNKPRPYFPPEKQ